MAMTLNKGAYLDQTRGRIWSHPGMNQVVRTIFRERVHQRTLPVARQKFIIDPVFSGKRHAETQQVDESIFLSTDQPVVHLAVFVLHPSRPFGGVQRACGLQVGRERVSKSLKDGLRGWERDEFRANGTLAEAC
jgi:hypothetical protein